MPEPKDDDYVPGAVDEDFDFTAADKPGATVPFDVPGENILDEEISVAAVSGMDADEIEKGSFRNISPGVHTLKVKTCHWTNKDGEIRSEKVYLKTPSGQTRAASYDARGLTVIFCLPDDPNCTVQDIFIMPPMNKNQEEAWKFGFKKESDAGSKKREEGGYNAKKLFHFLARLGFQFDTQKNPPPEASKLRNWVYYPGTSVNRLIRCEVLPPDAPREYIDKNGEKKTPTRTYPKVRFFSYAYVSPPKEATPQMAGSLPEAAKPSPVPAVENGAAKTEQPAPAATKGKGKKAIQA
jgi:hypothetical protein